MFWICQVLRNGFLGVKTVLSGGFSETRLATMQFAYEPEATAVVGVAAGVSAVTVVRSAGVAEGNSGAEVACACTVRATDVAMMDALSAEDPHAPSRKLEISRRESKGKVFFILVLSAWTYKGMPA